MNQIFIQILLKARRRIAAGILALVPVPVSADLPPEAQWQEVGVCARVKIRISQDVTLKRSAFHATLGIDNADDSVILENLAVSLQIKDSEGNPADKLFAVEEPGLTGIDDINGDGTLTPGSSGQAEWIIVPSHEATRQGVTRYTLGGVLSYEESGVAIQLPLLPEPILVYPEPVLRFDYFLPRVVFSDDPFTKDLIEPAEPFDLGLLVTNHGRGTASGLKITSAPPEILENEKQLLIDFKILGAQVDGREASPSLTIDAGDIAPAQTVVAQWIMTTSLQGKFVARNPELEHVDASGGLRLSLIDEVKFHELNHVVRAEFPQDDGIPDFLVNQIEDEHFLPDTLFKSDGSQAPVNIATTAYLTGMLSPEQPQVTLHANGPQGWIYIRVEDPAKQRFRLDRVLRSDGQEIRLNDNAWTTHRTVRLLGKPPVQENYLHLFDYVSHKDVQYKLEYTAAALSDIHKLKAPDQPLPVHPVGQTGMIPPVQLQTGRFSTPGQGNIHLQTRWQMSTEPTFSNVVLDTIRPAPHLSLRVPEPVVHQGRTYYWRAQFADNEGRRSSWSDTRSFSTRITNRDSNNNGIPDQQEINEDVDLDGDGSVDSEQSELKSLYTTVGNVPLAVQSTARITLLKSIEPGVPEEVEAEPSVLPLEAVALSMSVEKPGESVSATFYISSWPPKKKIRVSQYNLNAGWTAFPGHVISNRDTKSVTLNFIEGGGADIDQVKNGTIGSILAFSFEPYPDTGFNPIILTLVLGTITLTIMIWWWRRRHL